jgi:hypothetical protein
MDMPIKPNIGDDNNDGSNIHLVLKKGIINLKYIIIPAVAP